MYCILTHDKLSFFRLLKFPPDLSYSPVMTVCCLAKGKLDFLSLLLFLSGSDQRFKRNGVKVPYRLIDGVLDMPKKKKKSQQPYDAIVSSSETQGRLVRSIKIMLVVKAYCKIDLTVNFHQKHFIDPTNRPWVSEDAIVDLNGLFYFHLAGKLSWL